MYIVDVKASRVKEYPVAAWAYGIAFDGSGAAWLTGGDGRVYIWDSSGTFEAWNTGTATPATGGNASDAQFGWLYGVAFDAAGNMLLSEWLSYCRVWHIEANTARLRVVAGGGGCGSTIVANDPTQTQLNEASSVAFGPGGRSAFIADQKNHRVVRVMLLPECIGA